jgi:hypothetical protein
MDLRDGDRGNNIGREGTNARRAGRREWGKGRKVFGLVALASKRTIFRAHVGVFDPTAL